MQIDESREFCFCQYCGTKIMHERIIVEHKGEVSVEGVATYDDLFILGNDYFENSDYERAEVIFFNVSNSIPPNLIFITGYCFAITELIH